MSSGATNEEQRIRQLVTRLEEAYRDGRISEDVYERLSRKYQALLEGISGHAEFGAPVDREPLRGGLSGPRIVSVNRAGYRPAPKKDSAKIMVAFVAFLMILIMIVIATIVRR